jgi:aldose 1-epimerase
MTRVGPPTLSCGALVLTLSPETGGSVARFEYAGSGGMQIPVLRGTGDPAADVLAHGCFPLVPYCNRIRDGRFTFRGRRGADRAQHGERPEPAAWARAGWARGQVVRLEDAEAELLFVHDAGEWPWAYEARQVFSLDEAGLTVVLSCTNGRPADAVRARPASLFPLHAGNGARYRGGERLDDRREGAAGGEAAGAGRYDLRDRRVAGQDLDNGFGGWGGRATVTDPTCPSA